MLVATFGAFGFGRIQVAHRDASGWEAAQLTNDYSATGGRTFPYHLTPLEQNSFHDVPLSPKEEEIPTKDTYAVLCCHSCSRSPRVAGRPRRRDTISSVRPSFYEAADRAYWALPQSIRRPVRGWLARFTTVLEPEWRHTTVLVWGTWWGIMLAFTMFNVYLLNLLETRRNVSIAETTLLERTLWDIVVLTIGGCCELWCVSFFSFWRRFSIITKLGA